MSKQQIEKSARVEMAKLNEVIDWKIIKGMSYRREAERHKFLLRRLSGFKRPVQSAWSWRASFSGIF